MRNMNKKNETKLTTLEFAKRVGWSHDTVRRMIWLGRILAEKKNPLAVTSPYLIPESELRKVLNVKA